MKPGNGNQKRRQARRDAAKAGINMFRNRAQAFERTRRRAGQMGGNQCRQDRDEQAFLSKARFIAKRHLVQLSR